MRKEEISAISKEFSIPKEEILRVLKMPLEEVIKKYTSKNQDLDFNNFENEFVLSSKEKEVAVIKKFLPACKNARQAKTLFNLCPPEQENLRNEIIHQWIVLCSDLSELREVKPLAPVGSEDAKLAYKRYMELYF